MPTPVDIFLSGFLFGIATACVIGLVLSAESRAKKFRKTRDNRARFR